MCIQVTINSGQLNSTIKAQEQQRKFHWFLHNKIQYQKPGRHIKVDADKTPRQDAKGNRAKRHFKRRKVCPKIFFHFPASERLHE